MEKIINQPYVNKVLEPFFGRTLRITEGSLVFPESSMSTGFIMEPTGMGLSLYLKSDSSKNLNDSLDNLFFKSVRAADLYPGDLDRLAKDFDESKHLESYEKLYKKMHSHFMDNFKIKIGLIYIAGIETIEIRSNGFKINDTTFVIEK